MTTVEDWENTPKNINKQLGGPFGLVNDIMHIHKICIQISIYIYIYTS